ncbi:MAG TPA: glycoside hydrolase family 18 protein, partial [Candidatus Acidoferrum sp.]|nr:glycoside hydrolase family 18 protein [Candidatus Acidoferrum sp.]
MRFRSWLFPRLAFSFFVALIAAFTVPCVYAQTANAHHLPKRIVADYGYWSKYQEPSYSAAQIPFHALTHVNHAGVSFAADGSLSVPDGFIEPELNNRGHAAGVKIMLLLGGDFVGLETSGAVKTLVENIEAFAKQYHYDGVDIDWEYPATTADRRFLVELMTLLRKSNPEYVLS